MDAPSGYEIRAPRRDETARIADVLIAMDVKAYGSPDTDENDIIDDWAYEGFDIDTDAWVVARGDEIVGYAGVFKKIPGHVLEAYGGVHPDHEGRGIGRRLLERLQARAAAYLDEANSDEVTLQSYALGTDERAKDLHRALGFRIVRIDWSMSIDLTTALEAFPLPDGITVRRFQEGDEHDVHEVMEAAFVDHWQFSPTPYEIWHERAVATDTFDPELWLLAFDGERLVGAALNAERAGRGFVNDLGVLREARKRGLAAHLLYRSFELFKARGHQEVALFVDSENPTGATRLYERVGMRVARRYELYGKEIRR
ncbi:MAG: GNAT family N-acetyltransferase [Actinomycetota bacterium]